jgi:hypothetical protein
VLHRVVLRGRANRTRVLYVELAWPDKQALLEQFREARARRVLSGFAVEALVTSPMSVVWDALKEAERW